MKLAKSHKIILAVVALALSVMLVLCSLSLFTGKAEDVTSPNAGSYFNGGSAEFTAEGAKFTVNSGDTVSVKNELVIDDMKITFGAVNGITKLDLVLTYDSFYVNGNKKVEGETTTFDKEIVNTVKNVAVATGGNIEIKVENNVVNVNDTPTVGDYYKIRKVDYAVSKIEFKVTEENVSNGTLVIESIDQDADYVTGEYKQSLKLEGDKIKAARPMVTIDADMFVREKSGEYKMKAFAGEGYSLSYGVYSVLGNVAISELYPKANENVTIPVNNKNENQDFVHFQTDRTSAKFDVVYKDGDAEVVCRTVAPTILSKGDAVNTAPEYLLDGSDNVQDADALEAFKAELEKQYKKDGKFVPLGTEIDIPSMEDFVYDDRTPYDKLTKKLYFASKTESNSSSMKLKLDSVGDYYIYVVFTDSEDKAMDADDLVKVEDNGSVTYGKYGASKDASQKYIFYFSIDEDTEIVIEKPSKQGDGYKGTKYTASKFTITSSNCDITYKLEYTDKAEPTAEDWVEIKPISKIDEDYDENGYDYERLETIAYDGEYTFTPDATGTYRITVNVTSKMSFMSKSASTDIKIAEEVKVVTPPTTSWIEENVWSVVFLSVGTLCLAGILVLLFIKPKEKKTNEEEE